MTKIERLEGFIQRIERGFTAHDEIPGHPEFCSEATIGVRVRDCLLGSPESAANLHIDPPANLSPRQVLTALRMAVKWMEYDVALRELQEIKAGGRER